MIKYPIPKKLSKPITRPNKYKNQKVVIDGIKFDSKKEANRYRELKLLERIGEITDLQLQVRYELLPKYEINGKKIRAINYVADFVYKEHGAEIIEDVKGVRTDVYKIKKKMFEYKYKKAIRET